ncbi:hypothetical protein AeMF1_002677 [Aphanomyces euteiches]|nr:hypothetical protein AeMF1_002677 [Aphanomyces euteiches]KAH9191619.1 hypothetical protein AeNC1_006411 [Aphanomyces euteiches]
MAASKLAAFLADIKARKQCGRPIEVCVSEYTWKSSLKAENYILYDINAKFQPGSMTLILGAPGCGKSSLLKAIAGVLRSGNIQGYVAFNGVKTTKMQSVLQETLEFAHACRNNFPNFDSTEGTAAIIDMLGLLGCQNTFVGDDFIRGVSGGQRRRVTLGEMLTGQCPLLLLDEYTTGLDTTVATDITQKLRTMCNTLKYTVVTALLQPPPEVFELFDNVLILAEGNMAYFGFKRPSNTDDADFLQEVSTVFGQRYAVKPSVPVTGLDFHKAFRQSPVWTDLNLTPSVKNEVHVVGTKSTSQKVLPGENTGGQPVVDLPSPAELSYFRVVRMVFQRQLKLVLRDRQFNMVRVGQSLFTGLVIGSLFGRLGYGAANVPGKVGLIFLTILTTSVITLANIAYTIQIRSVFLKQSVFHMYPAWAYAAAESIIELIAGAIQFSDVENGSRYGVYYLLVFLNSLAITQCFKFIAASVATAVGGLIFGAATLFILVIFSGFAIQGPAFPSYLTLIFDINPGSWAFWGLVINEYKSSLPEYDMPHPLSRMRMGDYFIRYFGVDTDDKYISWGIGYLVFCYFFMTFATAFGYKFIRHAKKYPPKKKVEHGLMKSATLVSQQQISFTPSTVSFHSLHYTITFPKSKNGPSKSVELLSDIHGFFAPGTMTALMGTSGAGKSTLMDVLAGRKNSGKIKGTIAVNGQPLTKAMQKQFGYVEQNDLHCLTANVKEALTFSAYLRLADTKNANELIQATLKILELEKNSDTRISLLSNAQSKRVTIGVELCQPCSSILVIDEPTSGLDVHAAKVVLDAVERISKSGRTVICTIHQPSFVLFEVFDALLLLRSGGKMVYFGPLNRGQAVVDYFQAVPGVRALHLKENPATYMLDVLAANPTIDFTSLYWSSDLCKRNLNLSGAHGSSNESKNLDANVTGNTSTKYKAGDISPSRSVPYSTQLLYLGQRTARKYWRTVEYSFGRVLIAVFVAIIFGVLFQGNDKIEYTAQVHSQLSLVFIAPLFMGVIAVITGSNDLETILTSVCDIGLPVVDAERMVFFRERSSGMYATFPYSLVYALVEIPYVIVNSVVFCTIFYFMLGLDPSPQASGWFYLYYILYNLFATYLGQLLVVVLPDLRTAIVATAGVNSIFSLFAGFFIHKDKIPTAWSFMYWASPLHYAAEGMLATQFLDKHTSTFVGSKRAILSPVNTTIAEFTLEQFGGGLSLDNKVTNIFILVLIIIVTRILIFLGQQYLSFVTR